MSPLKRILIASDHAGVPLKSALQLQIKEWDWIDLGPSEENQVDYPDFAERVGQKISCGEALRGILICGSGIGMSIAANKIAGIRAALVDNPVTAKLSREHNNANVLCLGSRLTSLEEAVEIVHVWLETAFIEEPRHIRRIEKIHLLENSLGVSRIDLKERKR